MPLMKDIHWLAGLLEGEGSFGVGHKLSKVMAGEATFMSIQIRLYMTDRDVVAKAAKLLGWYSTSNYRRDKGLEVWRTGVSGRPAAAWMMTLYLLMGERRRGQIRDCLSLWKKHRQKIVRDKDAPCARGHWDRWIYQVAGKKPGKGMEYRKYLTCLECKREDRRRRTERDRRKRLRT